MIEMFKIKNELAPPIMNLITPAIFKAFGRKEKNCALWSSDNKLLVSTITVSYAKKH